MFESRFCQDWSRPVCSRRPRVFSNVLFVSLTSVLLVCLPAPLPASAHECVSAAGYTCANCPTCTLSTIPYTVYSICEKQTLTYWDEKDIDENTSHNPVYDAVTSVSTVTEGGSQYSSPLWKMPTTVGATNNGETKVTFRVYDQGSEPYANDHSADYVNGELVQVEYGYQSRTVDIALPTIQPTALTQTWNTGDEPGPEDTSPTTTKKCAENSPFTFGRVYTRDYSLKIRGANLDTNKLWTNIIFSETNIPYEEGCTLLPPAASPITISPGSTIEIEDVYYFCNGCPMVAPDDFTCNSFGAPVFSVYTQRLFLNSELAHSTNWKWTATSTTTSKCTLEGTARYDEWALSQF